MDAAPQPPRLATLDGLRGLGVMGILLMNIAGFALPAGAYFNPWGAGAAPSRADLAIWAADFTLIDGKMRALFSILFGASMLIVVRSAQASGDSPLRRHLARMAVLAGFGAVHLFLIWPGDILLHYAIVGMFAFPFTQIEPRQQVKAALMLLVLELVTQAIALAGFAHIEAHDPQIWALLAEQIGVGPHGAILADIAVHQGGWPAIVAHNLVNETGTPSFDLIFTGPETLAYMLIGMAALGSGLLAGDWPRRTLLRWAAIGYAAALPPTLLLCWLCFYTRFDTMATFAAATLGGVPFRPMLALADAALGVAWFTAGDGPLRSRIRAAGRAAFTNYLGSSLAMTAVFDGWGLGLFGRLDRGALIGIVIAAWAAMLAWSAPWLARFRYGPLEWLWRTLARGRIQPFKFVRDA